MNAIFTKVYPRSLLSSHKYNILQSQCFACSLSLHAKLSQIKVDYDMDFGGNIPFSQQKNNDSQSIKRVLPASECPWWS